ncbi:Flagellar biosynthesis protein FliR [Desulfurella amilsii]|uniref:Flagellar biosynthetic protein FliR n=1 Tax=Desulfurella amilsii TaxID=1562698 RepID=A0A1X4XYH9_9BACT|nr:flagellar biosynthetic protein FliR [Desulfurella amilsii]OSS42588.1 Flagellar biosynthesis protein FliR [Desulfurella amilsii]
MNQSLALLNVPFSDLEIFFLIFIRVASILLLAPIFSYKSIPAMVKILLSVVMAFVLYPIVRDYVNVNITNTVELIVLIVREILLGASLAFCIQFVWAGIEIAASLISFMMGFSIANVLSPQTNTQISIITEFESLFAILVFLAIDGQYFVIRSLVESFQLIPIGSFVINKSLIEFIVYLILTMFSVSVQILAPVVVALIITNIVFGIISRTMPQMNVLIASFPITITIGLFLLGVTFNFAANVMIKYYYQLPSYYNQVFRFK